MLQMLPAVTAGVVQVSRVILFLSFQISTENHKAAISDIANNYGVPPYCLDNTSVCGRII